MTVLQFFSILRARWIVLLAILAVTVGMTLAVSLSLPKKYAASASVVLDVKPDPVSAMMYPGMGSPAFVATQVDIIQSDRVAQRVVRNLKLADNPQIRNEWLEATGGSGSLEVWLAEQFQRNMDVKPARESNVVTITYKAPDPRFAAALANAFMQAYIDTTLELRIDPAKQYSTFFDTRSRDARDALERAQTKLSTFQREKGLIATDERLDVENARLAELSSQYVGLQALYAESGSRQAQIATSADRMAEVLNNPVVVSIKSDISRAEANLQAMNARLGDNHPQVVEAKANIAELRAKLDAETRRISGGVGVNNRINGQRVAELRTSLEAQRGKVLQLKSVRDEAAVLARDVESAQRSYDAVLARLNQTNLESQTTQSNVFALTQATPPLDPSSPRVFTNALIAVFGGTLLGVGAALVLELLDRRLRAVDEVSGALGLPVLGVMPGPANRRFLRGAKANRMRQRILAPLPAASAGKA
jgi:succinoglycan biosynthesis transport protein ExoP